MFAILITLRAEDLPARMGEMRLWLDQHRVEPTTFRYESKGDASTIRVAFADRAAAHAFRVAFDGTYDD